MCMSTLYTFPEPAQTAPSPSVAGESSLPRAVDAVAHHVAKETMTLPMLPATTPPLPAPMGTMLVMCP